LISFPYKLNAQTNSQKKCEFANLFAVQQHIEQLCSWWCSRATKIFWKRHW